MPTRTPLNTYRLQLHAGFTFADAAAQLDYLVELGVTDLYLSPIMEAVPGSTHGYDVVDPTKISAERGGRAGFEALATVAHDRGLGVIVDIVPNHMAIPTPLWLNPALWSALRDGADSPYADWFDIEAGARLVLPNLPDLTDLPADRAEAPETSSIEPSGGSSVQRDGPVSAPGDEARPFAGDRETDDLMPALIASGRVSQAELTLPDGSTEHVLTVDDQPYPLAPETPGLPLAEALAAQRYELRRWQGNHTRLTHRRFFDIVTLIGVRQELPQVFDATHALLLELFHAGHIDGFRVDHPDGLADPQGYFERLHQATGGAWVVAEKILSGDELLPTRWPVAGTTGYEASWRFDAMQLNPEADAQLAALARTTDEQPPATWAEVATQAKRQIADGSLAIDLDRLTRLALLLDPALEALDIRLCLRELLVALDRYRAYVRPGEPLDAQDAAVLAAAAARAAGSLPARLLPTLTWLHTLASGKTPTTDAPDRVAAEFVVRFQQVSGALVAKGVEDTAFYRWTQLLTLCEVGGDPSTGSGIDPATGAGIDPAIGVADDELAEPLHSTIPYRTRGTNVEPSGPAGLHRWLEAVNRGWPAAMSLGSSHDSKRSEDVRARIAAITEYPDEWAGLVGGLTPLTDDLPAPIRTILWQTLAGTWTKAGPIDADRLTAFLVKAGREQKQWTSWVTPNQQSEEAVAGAVPRLLNHPEVRRAFADWVDLTAESVRTNTLAAKLVQLTALGVADVYQGQETVRLSLTDPDNRRPVDFAALAGALAALGSGDGVHFLPNTTPPRQIWQASTLCGSDCTPGRSLPGEKLLLTRLALHLRKRHPNSFRGGVYTALETTTQFVWGFARGDAAITIATRLPRARHQAGGWQPTDHVVLPPGSWRNLFTGRHHTETFHPATDLAGWPVALLERAG